MKMVLASNNAGKLVELQTLFGTLKVQLVRQSELNISEAEEPFKTFVENALIKARAAAEASGLPSLADDSGLSVTALGGRPGVYTADWAERQWFEGPAGRDWFMAMGKVEGMLCELGPQADRCAWFSCVLALAWPDGTSAVYEGRVDGALTWPPRGALGFGYDPVFVPTGSTLTFAEIAPEEKHRISHRADAFAKLVAEQFGS